MLKTIVQARKKIVYRALFPFGGSGAGALGFIQARIKLLGVEARFESIGGIDFDREACKDFRYLTDSPAWCTDIGKLTVADSSSAWRERIGNAVPPPAARAIAERMLTALLQADLEAFALAGDGEVWVAPPGAGAEAA